MKDREQVRNLIAIEAAEWFDANRSETSDAERAGFVEWLKSSPLHVEEYLQVAVAARELRAARLMDKDYLEKLLTRAQCDDASVIQSSGWRADVATKSALPRRLTWLTASIAALGVMAIGPLLWNSLNTPSPATRAFVHFKTGHREQLTERLADNSTLHLDTDTDVSVAYGKTERTVTLNAGQAAFEVAHDVHKPFRVRAGFAQVIALGTNFDVRLEEGSTLVTVVAGRVAVGPAAGSGVSTAGRTAQIVEVAADQQIRAAAGAWPATPTAVDVRYATAWLTREIVFDHEPLGRVTAEFNRYAAKPISIETPALRALPISGKFAADDTESFIAFLRTLQGVRVEVSESAIRVSRN